MKAAIPLDFRAGPPPFPFVGGGCLRAGRVSVLRTGLPAAGEMMIGIMQVAALLHVGPPVRLGWCVPPGRLRSRRIRRGMVHVAAADRIVRLRWDGPMDVMVVALGATFVAGISAECGLGCTGIESAFAVTDWKLRHLLGLCEREMLDGGHNGALYLESLGAALAVHLLHHYGRFRSGAGPARGGIAPARLRHVLDYIEEYLAENVPLSDLAAIAGTSLHHFAHAFKQSIGVPSHHFLIERRVARARLLPADAALPIAEVALMLGFTDQSHFTEHFRHVTGLTPGRYRRDL